jgi:hypothetical protein
LDLETAVILWQALLGIKFPSLEIIFNEKIRGGMRNGQQS